MVTAKMPGVKTPCQKRQTSICDRLPEAAAPAVGTESKRAESTITRLRPRRSATTPAKGAARATAAVEAVSTRLTAPAETRNSRASMGSSGCGAYNVTKAQKPANITAAVRVEEEVCAAAGGRLVAMPNYPRFLAAQIRIRVVPEGPIVKQC